MSKETALTLNTKTLIGFTDKRGHAWHHRKELQGAESNHYPGPIPVEDVERRLFATPAVELSLGVAVPADIETMSGIDDRGNPIRWQMVPGRKAIARGDNFDVLGVFRSGYAIHQKDDWLLKGPATLLDDA